MLDNIALELPAQDMSDIKLIILDEAGNGLNGAKMMFELCIEEIMEDKMST